MYIYGVETEHIHHRVSLLSKDAIGPPVDLLLARQDHEIHENGGELPETTKYDYNDIRKKVGFTCIICLPCSMHKLKMSFLIYSLFPGQVMERIIPSSSMKRPIAASICRQISFANDFH